MNPIYNNSDNGFVIKCGWCKQVFQTVEELEAEYQRLHIPYKNVPIDVYKKDDVNQSEWDPTKEKEHYRQSDHYVGKSVGAHRSNKNHYSGFRWW